MNKKGQSNIMVVIMMVVIIAMISISVVWQLIRAQQDTTAIASDTFLASNLTCTRVTDSCITRGSTSTVENTTGTAPINLVGNFTECGVSGTLYGLKLIPGADNVRLNGATMNASYSEESCGRITGFTGTIIDYIPLLMAVLILVFVAGFIAK